MDEQSFFPDDGPPWRKNGKRKGNKKRNNDPLIDREVPFDLAAEKGVLGSILLMPDTCDDVVNVLKAEDFYDEAHAKLFHHIMDMHGGGKKIDMLLLRDRLISANDFELVGGSAGLAEIFTSVPNAAHVNYYAGIVRKKSTARNLILTCSELLNDAYRPDTESEALLNQAEQRIGPVADQR